MGLGDGPTGRLKVTVLDYKTNKPLKGKVVIIQNLGAKKPVEMVSDNDGECFVDFVAGIKCSIRIKDHEKVSKPGRRIEIVPIEVTIKEYTTVKREIFFHSELM